MKVFQYETENKKKVYVVEGEDSSLLNSDMCKRLVNRIMKVKLSDLDTIDGYIDLSVKERDLYIAIMPDNWKRVKVVARKEIIDEWISEISNAHKR